MVRRKRSLLTRLIFNPKTLIILGLAIIIVISIPISKNISKKYNIDQEILELEKEITAMESANTDFKKMITYLESDSFVEEQARLNLGLKKEGEEVIVIESTDFAKKASQKEILANGLGYGDKFFLLVWWDYFFVKKDG